MKCLKAPLLLALLAAAIPVSAYDTYRELSFVVDNKTDKMVRFVVDSEWTDGKPIGRFHVDVPAGGGNGFNLANGDLHDPNNPNRTRCRIVRVMLENVDRNKFFNTVDMTDMFGNKPNKMIDGPAQFIVEKVGNTTIVRRFLCSDGAGGW
jgi:hypothetical protein